jgi:hypothetical protein
LTSWQDPCDWRPVRPKVHALGEQKQGTFIWFFSGQWPSRLGSQYLVRREVVVVEKRTLELWLPRPPLQLLKPLSVGSGQGMLGTQVSPTITEPPLTLELSRSPPTRAPRVPPKLEPQEARTPPVVLVRMPLLPEKVTPPREKVELETKGSGPHTTPPRELLTAVEKNHQRGVSRSQYSLCLGGSFSDYTKAKH